MAPACGMYCTQQRAPNASLISSTDPGSRVGEGARRSANFLDERQYLAPCFLGRQLGHHLDGQLLEHHPVPVHNAPL